MIYQMWVINRSSASEMAAAQVTEAEREAAWKAIVDAHTQSGARPLLRCESSWADSRHPNWGITTFPSMEALKIQDELFQKLGFYRYYEPSFTLLGTADTPPNLQSIQPGWIYNLWWVYNDPAANAAWNAHTKEEQGALYQKIVDAMDRLGGCNILTCNAFWANDAYLAFGAETFPTLEAFQEFKGELEKINWPSYIRGGSLLGTVDLTPDQIKATWG